MCKRKAGHTPHKVSMWTCQSSGVVNPCTPQEPLVTPQQPLKELVPSPATPTLALTPGEYGTGAGHSRRPLAAGFSQHAAGAAAAAAQQTKS